MWEGADCWSPGGKRVFLTAGDGPRGVLKSESAESFYLRGGRAGRWPGTGDEIPKRAAVVSALGEGAEVAMATEHGCWRPGEVRRACGSPGEGGRKGDSNRNTASMWGVSTQGG